MVDQTVFQGMMELSPRWEMTRGDPGVLREQKLYILDYNKYPLQIFIDPHQSETSIYSDPSLYLSFPRPLPPSSNALQRAPSPNPHDTLASFEKAMVLKNVIECLKTPPQPNSANLNIDVILFKHICFMKVEISRLQGLPTPFYFYQEHSIQSYYQQLANIPNAFGLQISYAMKALANQSILKILKNLGAKIDASSFNEAKRAVAAGFQPKDITYTTQEILIRPDLISQLKDLVVKGMKFNVCSLRQFQLIKQTCKTHNIKLCVRIHPGKGAGESNSRNTGDQYSCFGVHLKDLPILLQSAQKENVEFDQVHIHVGSGGSEEIWKDHITNQISIIKKYFNGKVKKINFGGGLRLARMPDEEMLDLEMVGSILKAEVEAYGKQTGTQPVTVIEPGTFLVGNSGYVFTTVIDIKETERFTFVIINGGMEIITRPMLYGSQHPFYLYNKQGGLKSSDFNKEGIQLKEYVIVGRCCESGDSQTLSLVEFNTEGFNSEDKFQLAPRSMAPIEVGDILVIGGAGAYCSGMTLANYNSHFTPAQYLHTLSGQILLIREQQSFQQIFMNETSTKLQI